MLFAYSVDRTQVYGRRDVIRIITSIDSPNTEGLNAASDAVSISATLGASPQAPFLAMMVNLRRQCCHNIYSALLMCRELLHKGAQICFEIVCKAGM